jgi:excisionase family DNA binding protein
LSILCPNFEIPLPSECSGRDLIGHGVSAIATESDTPRHLSTDLCRSTGRDLTEFLFALTFSPQHRLAIEPKLVHCWGEREMSTTPVIARRLLRTKQAAVYLSMSEWKLRRLIQSEILPFVQDQKGGPFLVDVCDLDAYIEGNKHRIGDSDGWEPSPVISSMNGPAQPLRRLK